MAEEDSKHDVIVDEAAGRNFKSKRALFEDTNNGKQNNTIKVTARPHSSENKPKSKEATSLHSTDATQYVQFPGQTVHSGKVDEGKHDVIIDQAAGRNFKSKSALFEDIHKGNMNNTVTATACADSYQNNPKSKEPKSIHSKEVAQYGQVPGQNNTVKATARNEDFFKNNPKSRERLRLHKMFLNRDWFLDTRQTDKGHHNYKAETPLTFETGKRYDLSIFMKPHSLITTENGVFQINQEILKQITEIEEEFVVVGIAGLYRTGKSYLMNRLAGANAGFPLGTTIQSKTKGIWAWCRKHPKKANTVLLLLDTEGLGDVEKGDADHDNRIFTLSTLLCNVLVYNMMSAINEDVVQKLTFITEMSKNIRFRNRDAVLQDDQDLGRISPTFVLCLRDFMLDLVIDDKVCTPDEYLEHCITLKHGKGERLEKYNRPRECIRKYFPSRACFVFESPGDKRVLKNLEAVPDAKLPQDFLKESERFLAYVYECKPKSLLGSKPITGKMFASLIMSYVEAMKTGAVPDVDDAITTMSKIENERVAMAAVKSFEEQLAKIVLPIFQASRFDQLFHSIQKTALVKFRQNAMMNSKPCEERATDTMKKLWELKKRVNLELVRRHCDKLLQQLKNSIIKPLQQYKVTGGYTAYRTDKDNIKSQYNYKTKEFDQLEAKLVLQNFMEKEEKTEREIMMADQRLTAEERQNEIAKMKQYHEQAQKEQKQLLEKRLSEEKERSEKHFAELKAERIAHFNNEEKRMRLYEEKWRDSKALSEKHIEAMKIENEEQRSFHMKEMEKMRNVVQLKEEKMEKLLDEMREKDREKMKRQQELNDRLTDTLSQLQASKNYNNNNEAKLQRMIKEKNAEMEKLNNRGFFARVFNTRP